MVGRDLPAAPSTRPHSAGGNPLVIDPSRHFVRVEPNELPDLQEGDATFSDEASHENDFEAQPGCQGLTIDQSYDSAGDSQMPILDNALIRRPGRLSALRLDGSGYAPPTMWVPAASQLGIGRAALQRISAFSHPALA